MNRYTAEQADIDWKERFEEDASPYMRAATAPISAEYREAIEASRIVALEYGFQLGEALASGDKNRLVEVMRRRPPGIY